MRQKLALLKEAVKKVVALHHPPKEPARSPRVIPSTVTDEVLQQEGYEGEFLVQCIERVLMDGLHPEAETWHYLLNLERESLASLFALGALQVKAIRNVPNMTDAIRLKQWVRLCLNQGTLLSAIQLLSLFPMITRAYYQESAILMTEEDTAVLFSVLAPVGGMPWAERKDMIDEMGEAASQSPIYSKDNIRFALDVDCPIDALPPALPPCENHFEEDDDIIAGRSSSQRSKEKKKKKKDGETKRAKKIDPVDFERAREEWQRERKALLKLLEQQQLTGSFSGDGAEAVMNPDHGGGGGGGCGPERSSSKVGFSAGMPAPSDHLAGCPELGSQEPSIGCQEEEPSCRPLPSAGIPKHPHTTEPAPSINLEPALQPPLEGTELIHESHNSSELPLPIEVPTNSDEDTSMLPPAQDIEEEPSGLLPADSPSENPIHTSPAADEVHTTDIQVAACCDGNDTAEPMVRQLCPETADDTPLPVGSPPDEQGMSSTDEVGSIVALEELATGSQLERSSCSSHGAQSSSHAASSSPGRQQLSASSTPPGDDSHCEHPCWRARRAAQLLPVEAEDPLYPVYLYYHSVVRLAQSLAGSLPTSDACGLEFQLFLLAQRQQFATLLQSWGEKGAEVRALLRDSIPEPNYHVPPVMAQWTAKDHRHVASWDSAESDRRSNSDAQSVPDKASQLSALPSVVTASSTTSGPGHRPTISITSDDWFTGHSESSSSSIVVQSSLDSQPSTHQRGAVASESSQHGRHRMRFDLTVRVAPPKTEAYIRATQQGGYCKGCLTSIGRKEGPRPHYCHYTGWYYCSRCYKGSVAPIPALMVAHWDFYEYKVCEEARQFLENIWLRPLICISAINPLLFDKVPSLATARKLRLQLNILYGVLKDCKDVHWDGIPAARWYYMEETELYSMWDLKKVHDVQPKLLKTTDPQPRTIPASELLMVLKGIRQKLVAHAVKECRGSCTVRVQQRCSLCSDTELLYIFDINNTIQCPRCSRLYHKACYKLQPCRWCFASG